MHNYKDGIAKVQQHEAHIIEHQILLDNINTCFSSDLLAAHISRKLGPKSESTAQEKKI